MTPESPRKLHFLVGPTAVGKTALALDWAELNDAEILSCDSLLVYRGMDIGTAKPTQKERSRMPHHLIDIAEPNEAFSVGAYLEAARKAVADVHQRGRPVLISGGSGFYLKAFFSPVIDDIEVPEEIRQRIIALDEAEGLTGLVARLQELNPNGLPPIDLQNPRRVFNALIRCEASGRTLHELRNEFASRGTPFDEWKKQVVLLERDREDLHERVRQRTRAMIEDGLVEETIALRLRGFEANPSAARAIGYRETLAHLDHKGTLEDLESQIVANTIGLIKKQRTWLRHQVPIHKVTRLDVKVGIGAHDLFSP